MRSKRLGLAALAPLLCLPLLSPSRAAPQGPGTDIGAFVKEIMVVDIRDDRTQLAMWFPQEFFVASLVAQGTPRAQAERDTEFIKPFLVIFVQNRADRPDGTSTYLGEKEVRARAVLRLAGGAEVPPLERIPPAMAAVLAAMRTMIAAEGDAGSANMHVVVFPNSTAQGKVIVNSAQKESLTLLLKAAAGFRETTFNWRTPFDAVAGTPPCPRCKAAMSSKWSYCPYDGQKLTQ